MLRGEPSKASKPEKSEEEARAERARKAEEARRTKQAKKVAIRAKSKRKEQKVKDKLQYEMDEKWKEKQVEVFQFRALLSSRSNIFVHGANGTGKTSFVTDCIMTQRQGYQDIPQNMCIEVDCIEFFSEKLIAVKVSSQLRYEIRKIGNALFQNKVITHGDLRSFGFKNCTNIDQLYEALKAFPGQMERFKEKKIANWYASYAARARPAGQPEDPDARAAEFDEVSGSG